MSTALLDQLADYGSFHDDYQGNLDAADIMTTATDIDPLVVKSEPQRRRMRLRGVLVAAAAAVAVLLLVGGLAWLSGSTPGPDVTDSPTVTSAPATTAVAPQRDPEFEEQQVIPDSTPLGIVFQATTPSSVGDIALTVLEGGPALVPSGIVETDDGYAATTDGGKLMVSSDGASWNEIPLPETGEPRALDRRDGRYVLEVVADNGVSRFWETNDFQTWQPTLGAPPELLDAASGLGVITRVFPATRADSQGATLTFWNVFVRVDWREIALLVVSEDQNGVQELFVTAEIDHATAEIELVGYVDQRDAFDGKDPDLSLGRLEMVVAESGDRWTVDLSVAGTGERLGSIEGSLGGMSFQDAFDRLSFGLFEEYLTLETATGLEFVAIPWNDPDNGPEFVANEEGFVAARRIGGSESPFRMEVWASPDGREWQLLTVATSEEMGDINSFAERDGVMIVTFGHTDDVSRYVIWRSEDGTTWAPPSSPPVPTWEDFDDGFGNVLYNATGDAYGLPSGWVWLSGNETDFALWTSPDGDVWEQVDLSGIPGPFWSQFDEPDGVSGSGGSSQWISGNSIFIGEEQTTGNRQLPSKVWIISIPR